LFSINFDEIKLKKNIAPTILKVKLSYLLYQWEKIVKCDFQVVLHRSHLNIKQRCEYDSFVYNIRFQRIWPYLGIVNNYFIMFCNEQYLSYCLFTCFFPVLTVSYLNENKRHCHMKMTPYKNLPINNRFYA
jgi:hypothetical protein